MINYSKIYLYILSHFYLNFFYQLWNSKTFSGFLTFFKNTPIGVEIHFKYNMYFARF